MRSEVIVADKKNASGRTLPDKGVIVAKYSLLER
jgi:hypothetical protein